MNSNDISIRDFFNFLGRALSDASFYDFFETSGPYFLIHIILLILLISIIYYIYSAICLSRIAKRTKTPGHWLAWIPIFNFLLMVNIARKPEWWVFLFFIPIVNIFISVLVWMGISSTLGKSKWLGILIIITPINLFIPGYLAFSKNKKNTQGPTIIAAV